MFDNGSGERAALNWRAPLLAAAIFAGVFGILLLMAHLNQSKTSDEGSSFRQDPYGTSLFFNSLERAGYQVKRGQDEKSLADLDATRTTAFFIGGDAKSDIETRDGKLVKGRKFQALLEDFLGRGGRVVLLQHQAGVSVAPLSDSGDKPKAADPKVDNPKVDNPKVDEPKWQIEKTWGLETEYKLPENYKAGPVWAAPVFPAMLPGSEMMYLRSGVPWLKTDAQWTAIYAGPLSAINGPLVTPKADAASPGRVYAAMRRVGNGELVAASQESFLLNEAIGTHPNPVLLDFLVGARPTIWVDETLHGLHQEEGVLWLVQRYRLQAALLLFWATLLAMLWNMNGDLVRRPARNASIQIIRHGEGTAVAAQRLLQRSISSEEIVAACWEQFRRRSPQDAQAISADPHWALRLRAALSGPPLAGYKELRHLIAERRALAKGFAHANREVSDSHLASPKKTPQEEPIA
jgi:hypothetical protein